MTLAHDSLDDKPSAEPPPAPRKARWLSETGIYVRRQVTRLADGYLANKPGAVAMLARLRYAAGKPLGSVPEVLRVTIDGLPAHNSSAFYDLYEPSPEEFAAHTAITLFGIHQQSNRNRRMQIDNRSIATAAGYLCSTPANEKGVERRFQALGTASSPEETIRHALALIRMLSTTPTPIAFDYGLFADEIQDLLSPDKADGVRLRWGRDFYRAINETSTSKEKP